MDNKNKSFIADISLILVAFIWGVGFPATKIALNYFGPMSLLAIRFFISTIILAIIFRNKIKNINKYDIKSGFVCGIFLFGGFSTQTLGMVFTTSSKVAFITGIYVVMVPFFYWIINKKRPDKYNLIAAILTTIGIYLLTYTGENLRFNIGDGFALACAVFFALQIISVGHYVKKTDVVKLTIIQFLFSGIFSLLFAIFTETMPSDIDTIGIGALIFLALFSTCIGFFTQNIAQKYTTESHTAILLSLESVFGSLMSVMILKEEFTFIMFIGCTIIFTAIITAETKWSFILKNNKA